ncbi:MAG: substrate-binding domain-containing protein [Desulfovibrionaceae bacterium]|nr:substrate-binding domain-containing protein [Desulfovibrionaceae bacterium]MBF0514488.1 substrate-binding domain-containing protein [Desulfovibrionaceae bacterium]
MKLIDRIARGRAGAAKKAGNRRGARAKRPGGAFFLFTARHGVYMAIALAIAAAFWFYHARSASVAAQKNAAPPSSAARQTQNPDKDAAPLARLTALLGPLPKPAKAYRLAAILPYYGEEYWQVLARGMQSRAMELGLSIEMPAAASPGDEKGELNLAMRELDRGCDALLLAPVSAAALAPAVARARAARIPVLCVGQAEPVDGVPRIGPSQFETGVRAAACLLEQFPKGGKIVVLAGDLAPSALSARALGMSERLAGSKITVAETAMAGPVAAEAMAAFRDVLSRRPDLAGVYCASDALALAAAQVLAEPGQTGKTAPAGKPRLIGTGGESRAYDAIRQGALGATIDFFAYINGQAAVDGAVRLLAGQSLPALVATPQNCVTAKNLDNPLPAGSGN